MQVFCATGAGRRVRDPEEGPRQAGEGDSQVHAGRDPGGFEVGRAAGEEKTADGEPAKDLRASAAGGEPTAAETRVPSVRSGQPEQPLGLLLIGLGFFR